jgi:FG-GAP repeat/Prealbumin-like fold domain
MIHEAETCSGLAWLRDGGSVDTHRRARLVPRVLGMPLAAGLLAVLLLSLSQAGLQRSHGTVPSSAAANLRALPLAAQSLVSRTVGHDQASYRVHRAASGLTAANDRHGLTLRFGADGVHVRAGSDTLTLRLRAAGYGQQLTRVPVALPEARANQVTYRRGSLDEWYVNGPVGLEQGFTVHAAPAGARTGPLTLALSLSGTLNPSLEYAGSSLSFAGSSLRYAGLEAFDARGHRLPARLELRGQSLLIRVDDAGAPYPLTIDPFIQQAKLTASDPDPSIAGQFGTSVAIDGDTIAVGAFNAKVAGQYAGAVYVFTKPAGGWAIATETAKLTASDAAVNDQLSNSVAIAGGTIAAGAPGKVAVYVFVKPAGGWANATQTAKLVPGNARDGLGVAVAISGNTIVAGAPGARVLSLPRGAAFVFVKPAAGWSNATQTAKLTASDGAQGDWLGQSVAISGDTIVAGAPQKGAVYVFVKPSTGWANATQRAKLTGSGGGGGEFGDAVAIASDTIVAGAHYESISGGYKQGAVYVFAKPASGWATGTETAKLTASDGGTGSTELGSSVAIAGVTIAAGAAGWPYTAYRAQWQGAVYVFSKPAGGWANAARPATLIATDGAAGDHLGESVAIDGDSAVAGAPGERAAYVFRQVPATIKVIKHLLPVSDPGRFDLKVGATVVKAGAVDGESGLIPVDPGTYQVSETAVAGTSLSDYAKSIACTRNGNPGPSASASSLQVTVATGDVLVCTITNSRKATVSLTKHLIASSDVGRFDLKIGGMVVKAAAGDGDSGSIQVPPGTWTVLETGASGTSLTEYSSSIACTLNGNPGPSGDGASLQVTLAPRDALACTLTNTHKPTITLTKQLVPASDAGRFDLRIGQTVVIASAGDGGSGSTQVLPGTYRVTESGVPGTSLSNYATSIACTLNGGPGPSANGTTQLSVNLAPGDQLACTLSNRRKAQVTLIKHLIPSADPGRFDLKLTSNSQVKLVKTSAGDGDSGSIQVAPGTWTVVESAASGTNLSDYSSSIACTLNGSPGPSGSGTSLPVTLAPADVLACTITNNRN